jgi:hypothetical protein
MVEKLKRLLGWGVPYADVLEQIRATAKLQTGWNTYRAGEISEVARRGAIMFIHRLSDVPGIVPEPSVVPLANSGIALHWETDRRDIVLTFRSDGMAEYTVADQNDDVIAEGPLDRIDVKDVIRHVTA